MTAKIYFSGQASASGKRLAEAVLPKKQAGQVVVSRDYFAQEAADLCGALGRRQRSVLVLTAKGLTMREIAVALEISLNTVIEHRRSLYRALGVGTSAEAVVLATKAGLA